MKIHNIDATGSFTYNGVDLSNLTGSTSDSGSFSTQILNLNQVSSSLNSFTSSINTTIKSKLDSESVISGSIQVSITGTTGYSTFSSSVSSSIGDLSGSVATTTSGLSSSIGSLSSSVATTTSDLSSSVGSLSSSVATTTGNLSSRIGSVETKTGSYATTGSNIFVGSQVITGSLYITNDMVVQGCSCLQNITASAVSIGTNTVVLNTATPAVRFAGVSVQDSGSNDGVTGSIYWDGLCNRWVYSNPSGIGYSGGMLLSGPRTSTLGSESPLTCNYLAKSGGGDHLYDSIISETGSAISVAGTISSTDGTNISTLANNYLRYNGGDFYIDACVVGGNFRIRTSNVSALDNTALFICGKNSYVGIGTATPSALLNLYSGTEANLLFTSDGAGGDQGAVYLLKNTGGGLTFAVENRDFIWRTGTAGLAGGGGCERMRLDSSGNLTVGSTDAGNAGSINVSVGCAGTTAGGLQLWAANNQTHYVQFGDGTAGGAPYAGYVAYAHATDSLSLGTGTATRVTISSTGVACFSNTVCVPNFYMNGGVINQTSGDLSFWVPNVGQAVTITQNTGRVGIGCTTPGQSLTIQSTGVSTYLKTTSTADSTTYGNLQMYRQACKVGNGIGIALGLINSAAVDTEYAYIGTLIESCTNAQECGAIGFYTTTAGNGRCERLRITSAGNVGIGTLNPQRILTVYNSNSATLYQTPTSGTGANDGLYVGQVSDVSYVWNYNSFPLAFGTAATERMRISNTGISCFACQICVKEAVYVYGSFPGVKLDRAGTTAQSDINWKDAGTSVWSIGTAVQAIGSNLDFYNYTLGGNVLKLTTTGEACFKYTVCAPRFVGPVTGVVTGFIQRAQTGCIMSSGSSDVTVYFTSGIVISYGVNDYTVVASPNDNAAAMSSTRVVIPYNYYAGTLSTTVLASYIDSANSHSVLAVSICKLVNSNTNCLAVRFAKSSGNVTNTYVQVTTNGMNPGND